MADHDPTTGRPTTIDDDTVQWALTCVLGARDQLGPSEHLDRLRQGLLDAHRMVEGYAAAQRQNHALQLRIQDGWASIETRDAVIDRLCGGWEHVHSVRPEKPHSWVRHEAFTHQVRYEPLTAAELAVMAPKCSLEWPCACGIGAPDA